MGVSAGTRRGAANDALCGWDNAGTKTETATANKNKDGTIVKRRLRPDKMIVLVSIVSLLSISGVSPMVQAVA